MRTRGVAGAVALLAAVVSWAAVAPPARAAGTFEEAAAQAATLDDVGVLLGPFVDDCARSKREPERGRCLGVRAFLRKDLPSRSFVMTRPGAEVLGISDMDPAIKGFHVALSGCMACNPAAQVGGEKRLVTLKPLTPGARSMGAATELGRTTVSFANLAESERWTRTVRPHLRAEYVFQPADQSWTSGASKGLLFKPLAFRVYDACTGLVLLSQPPSRESAPKDSTGCKAEPAQATAEAPAAPERESIDRAAVSAAVKAESSSFDACIKEYPRPGTAMLVFVVAPTGLPLSVSVEGGTAGTVLGQCLIDAGRRVRFPQFQGGNQKLRYPLALARPE
jgi:hypothetical protein